MKIVLITAYFAPAWSYGGPPRVFSALAQSFRKKGHDITVITTDAKDEERNKILSEKMDGIQVNRYPTISNYLAYKLKLFFVPGFLDKIQHILKESDIVIFSDLRTVINLQIYPFLKKNRIPYCLFAFGQIPYDRNKKLIKKIFDYIWVRDFVKNAIYKFAQTEHEKSMYNEYFPADR